MATTFGTRPEDTVADPRGNVLSGVVLSLYPTKPDAQARTSLVATVSTNDKGLWPYDDADSRLALWARDPAGHVWAVEAEGSTAADFTQQVNDARDAAQLAASLVDAPSDTVAAALVAPDSGTQTASVLSASYALKGEASNPGLAPLFVDTIAGVARTGYGAANARTGFAQGTAGTDSGWDEEMAVAVTGVKGATSLTSSEPTKVAGFGAQPFDVVLTNTSDSAAQFNTVMSASGSTINLRKPLLTDVTGYLASRVDVTSGGQHMTKAATKGLAQHVAAETALYGQRGRIIAGCWDTEPPAYQVVWALNAATVAYGESNTSDGGATVRTYMVTQTSANITNFDGIAQRRTGVAGGVQVGTHLAGHGATGTLFTGRRDCVLEFWTASYRDVTSTQVARRLNITVKGDGNTLLSESTDGYAHRVRVSLTGVDKVTIDVTNADGTPSYIYLSQTLLREPGQGSVRPLVGKRIVCLGDSWFAWYGGAFAAELARVTGSTVVNHAKGGMTTDWALSWFDAYVLAEKPDVCVLNFYTNDLNNLQNATFVDPSGATVARWPNGLTQAQCQARWRSQILLLVKRCQDAGIKPVVLLPGGANFTNQWPASAAFEQPALLDWNATPSELADPTAYINTVGKATGATVKVGTSVKYAKGPLPSDPWVNVSDDALTAMQKKTLKRSDYNRATGVVVGTDTNSDGLSDGFDFWDVGSMAADTIVASIVSGRQRVTSTWGASGGNRRLRMYANVVAGREYLVLYDVVNATPSMTFGNSFSDITGAAVLWNSVNGKTAIDATGAGQVYYRATAATTASRYAALSPTRINSGTNTHDVSIALVIDLTALFADAPNLATLTTADLVAFVLAIQP